MKKRICSLILVFAIMTLLVPNGLFVTTVSAYSTGYPNTHVNTGNQLEDLIAVAETQIGYTYSSGTKYGAWYGSDFTYSSWCAMFVSWCANQAGIPTSIIPKHASCDVGMNWFKNNNRWHNAAYYGGNYTPQRGDIVYYSDGHTQSDSTHVGIITGLSGNYLQVIEGNTDSKVHKYTQNSKRTLSNAYVLGYGTPNYNGANIRHTRDTNYGTNFTATAKIHIDVFNEDHSDPGNYYIDPGDVCTIHEVYTDGCCKVTYPASGAPGGTRTYYCKFNSTNFSWGDPLSLTFSPYSLTLKEGETATVNIKFSGDGIYSLGGDISNSDVCSASFNGIDWSSGTSSITVTGNSAGTSKITVYFYDTSGNAFYSQSFDVNVTPKVNTLSLTFSPSSLSLKEGETATVNIKFSGDGIYSLGGDISNGDVCSASFNGIDWSAGTSSMTVTGNSAGTSKVTVYFYDTSGNAFYSQSFDVNVTPKVNPLSLTFSPSSLSLKEGETATVSIKFSGDGIYSLGGDISNGDVCSASFNGIDWSAGTSSLTVTGNSAGTSKITVYFNDTSGNAFYSQSFDVTVTKVDPLSLTFSPSSLSLKEGESATVSVKFTGEGIFQLGGDISNGDVCSASFNGIDWGAGTSSLTVTGNSAGTAQLTVYLYDTSGNSIYSNSFTVNVSKADTNTPTASISSTNNVASSQTVTLTMSDDTALAGYYWGTSSSTSPSFTSISGINNSTTRTVSSSGTYYLTVKDSAGNVTQKSITFYKTTLNANSGSVSPSSVLTASGNSFTFPTPTRSDYNYKGWSTSSTASSGIYSLTPSGNYTYYAVWKQKTSFTLFSTNNVDSKQEVALEINEILNLDGYYWGTNADYSKNQFVEVSYVVLGDLHGYTDRWQDVESPGTYYATLKGDDGISETASITFYKTTLNANGGSVSPSSVLTESSKSFTLPTPTRSGYTFKGWSTSSTATSGIYSLTPSGNSTYYAVWSIEATDTTKPTASISATNDVASSQTVTLTMGDDTALSGYYWGTSSSTSPSFTSISGKSYSAKKDVNTNGTYYLTVKDSAGNVTQKSITFYKTTLNANGGSVSPSSVLTESGKSFTFPTPTRSGYTYNGWSSSSTATSGINSLTPSVNGTYYAVWQSVPATNALIKVASVKGTAGKTVDVTISLSNNPGIVAMTLNISYNTSALTLIDVKDANVLGASSHKPEKTSPYTLSWANDTATSNYTANGTIATLTFEIKDGVAVGNYPITVSYDYNNYGIYDKDLNKVNFNTENGAVEVIDVIYGDVDDNGIVNNLDRVYLTRYLANWDDYQNIDLDAADVDCNGNVNNLDRVILTRYLANWSAYSELPYQN